MLEEKGLVQVRQGAGTTVTAPAMWNMLDELVLAARIANSDGLDVLDDLVTALPARRQGVGEPGGEHLQVHGSPASRPVRRLEPWSPHDLRAHRHARSGGGR